MELVITIITLITAIISAGVAVFSYLEARNAKKGVEKIKQHLHIGDDIGNTNNKQTSKGSDSPNFNVGRDFNSSGKKK